MRSSGIKLWALALLLAVSTICRADNPPVRVADKPDAPSESISHYEQRSREYVNWWHRVIPSYSKLQFAGGMGLISWGIGWDYGRKDQWETDLFIGLLPRCSGKNASATITLKQNYIPWKIQLSKKWMLEPLETGIYMNKLTSRNFWGREPEKYNGHYYRFATNTRFSVFAGQRITVGLGDKFLYKSISFFYELSTCDLYLISAVTNRSIRPDDILTLSFGLKFQFL